MATQVLMPALSPTMEEGTLAKWLVKEGDTVKEGQGVIVVEAMKMENELRTPKAGVVKEIKVKEGDAVEAGARLALIE